MKRIFTIVIVTLSFASVADACPIIRGVRARHQARVANRQQANASACAGGACAVQK